MNTSNEMSRRQLLAMALMASFGTQAGYSRTNSDGTKGSKKKGIGMGGKSPNWIPRMELLNVKWFYTWGSRIPEGAPAGFVPMIWGFNRKYPQGIAKAGAAAKVEGLKYLLGFNEPDKKKQANMSVERALDAWPLLMDTGLKLGSPACVHPDSAWMKAFMAGVKKRGFRVDFVCVHSYGGANADGLIKRLKTIHRMYDRPLWITEFAVGDWTAKTVADNKYNPRTVARFMKDVLPQLDRMDAVERYAWFPAGQKSSALGTSALFDSKGGLTPLGEIYSKA